MAERRHRLPAATGDNEPAESESWVRPLADAASPESVLYFRELTRVLLEVIDELELIARFGSDGVLAVALNGQVVLTTPGS